MDAVIISIGTELTTGQSIDTNAAWIARRLTEHGLRVVVHETVGDDQAEIRDAIRRSLDRADAVLLTGGLGPTPDDLTRFALAEVVDRPLEQHADALQQILAMFQRWGRNMSKSNEVQALAPRGCRVMANPRGTAPGLHVEHGEKHVFAMPGVPGEMQTMFEAHVLQVLAGRAGGAVVLHGRLQCFGVSEAKIGDLLSDLMARDRNPQVGTTASRGVITVRVYARGSNRDEADALLREDLAEIRRRVGRAVFGEAEDTLESVVGRILTERGKTVATVESCTGGLLAKRLTDVPGSSVYFERGFVTYANEAKVDLVQVPADLLAGHGAVSEPVARAMAIGCRTASGSDVALSVTGIAGPKGGKPPQKPVGLVYLGLADKAGVEVKRVQLGEHLTRMEIRDRACSAVLNLLRLRLMELTRS